MARLQRTARGGRLTEPQAGDMSRTVQTKGRDSSRNTPRPRPRDTACAIFSFFVYFYSSSFHARQCHAFATCSAQPRILTASSLSFSHHTRRVGDMQLIASCGVATLSSQLTALMDKAMSDLQGASFQRG